MLPLLVSTAHGSMQIKCTKFSVRYQEAGPKIAAIFSILESYRKFGVPVHQYLEEILPGLADRSILSLTGLTPAAYAAKRAKQLIPNKSISSTM